MPHDLVIRNGLVVDGTGAPAYPADVAIDGDTIVGIGSSLARGTREIDADSRIVTPGFIDLHTHLDAQVAWDPALTPTTWHGITTVLMGNCGVTFAPCKARDRETLAHMMESVEDIPHQAILEGMPWDWDSYGEYLDSIDKLDLAINAAGLVGHSALRFYVMGERAVEAEPTPEQIREMASLAAQAVEAGAMGFSSNRHRGHALPDGRPIPGTEAKPNELQALSEAVGAVGGIVQLVLNYRDLEREMTLVADQARAAGTPLIFTATFEKGKESERSGYDKSMDMIRNEGLDVTGLTLPRSGGMLSGLTTDLMPSRKPLWRELRSLEFSERLARIQDPGFRGRLVEETRKSKGLAAQAKYWFWLGEAERPNYLYGRDDSLASLASAAGESLVETWLRLMLATEGRGFFHVQIFNNRLDNVRTLLEEDWILPGLGDAGAHVGQIVDSGWTTFFLSHWVRDVSLFSLEEAVLRMTSAPARVLGLSNRGRLIPGMRADLNVIDVDRLAERQPTIVHDFPGQAPRLIQRGEGFGATICNGQIIVLDDELTGACPGGILRSHNAARDQ